VREVGGRGGGEGGGEGDRDSFGGRAGGSGREGGREGRLVDGGCKSDTEYLARMCMRACQHMFVVFAVRVRVCAYTDTRVCVHVCVYVRDRERESVRACVSVCVPLDAQPVAECAACLLEKFNTHKDTHTPRTIQTHTYTHAPYYDIGMITKYKIDPIMFNNHTRKTWDIVRSISPRGMPADDSICSTCIRIPYRL
jgi:hypothetical protein